MDTITIQDSELIVCSPEGSTARMPLAGLMQKLSAQGVYADVVLPDGVKCVFTRGPALIWAIQRPPGLYCLKWISPDSPAPFGPHAKYRTVRVALPYLIVMAAFIPHGRLALQLSSSNEAFFMTEPLVSQDQELLYPALLNCSKFTPPDGRPLSWICTQHLDRRLCAHHADTNTRLREGVRALMYCLLETGFNRSSERHEGNSWFAESAKADPRIATVEDWEKASTGDPLFVLNVPWLRTGLTVKQVAERMFDYHRVPLQAIPTSADLARLIYNHSCERRARK